MQDYLKNIGRFQRGCFSSSASFSLRGRFMFFAHAWIVDEVGIRSHLIGLAIAPLLLIIYVIGIIRERQSLTKKAVLSLFLFTISLPFFALNFGYFAVYYSTTKIIEEARFENYAYLIVYAKDADFHGYETFYKCPKWRFVCDGLYGSYRPTTGWKIIVDKRNKEVSLFDEVTSSVIYTDVP